MSSKFRFRLTAGLGFGSIVAMLVLFVFSGVAFPLHVAGLGDFFIAADTVDADGFLLTPTIDANGASTEAAYGSPAVPGTTDNPPALPDGSGAATQQLGTGLVSLDTVDIGNLKLQKRITVAPGFYVKATITGGAGTLPVSGSGVTISAGHICADSLTLTNLNADDPGVDTADPLDDLLLEADTASIDEARIQATGLTANTITIPSLQLKVSGGDYDSEFTAGCLTE